MMNAEISFTYMRTICYFIAGLHGSARCLLCASIIYERQLRFSKLRLRCAYELFIAFSTDAAAVENII